MEARYHTVERKMRKEMYALIVLYNLAMYMRAIYAICPCDNYVQRQENICRVSGTDQQRDVCKIPWNMLIFVTRL